MSFFFSSRRRHTRSKRDWSSDVCSSDLLPGLGVLVRRMVRGKKDPAIRKLVFGPVTENVTRAVFQYPPASQIIQIGIEPDLAQRHHDMHVLQTTELPVKKCRAVRQFFGQRLVGRWSASHRRCDVKIPQTQAVLMISRIGLVRKTRAI